MARMKMSERLAKAEAEAARLSSVVDEQAELIQRERREKRALATQVSLGPDGMRARIAQLLVTLDDVDAKPDAWSWDNICDVIMARMQDLESSVEYAKSMAQNTDCYDAKRSLPEALDKIESAIGKLQEAQQTVDGLPDTYVDWLDMMKGDLTPNDVDRMIALLEILGLSGAPLRRILQSADMAHALQAEAR
jgi:hypothetical protein